VSRPELSQYTGEGEGKGRQYKHPFRTDAEGKPLLAPSVTTVLKLEDKSALIQWAVNLTVDWAVRNVDKLLSMSVERGINVAKYRWRDQRDTRAFVGTGVHDYVEAEHTGSWMIPELDDEQLLMVEEWRKLNEEWDIEPILSEFTMWSLTHEYAGTADGLWRFTHKVTGESFVAFIDLKTSKNTWPGHHMQISALINADVLMHKLADGAWEELPVPQFDRVLLIHLRAPEFDEFGNKKSEGKHDLIEVTDTDEWFQEFLGYRAVLKAQAARKSKEKKREAKVGGFGA